MAKIYKGKMQEFKEFMTKILKETRPDIAPKSTRHRPDIDPTSTGNRPDIDRKPTGNRPDIDRKSTEI